MRHLFVSSLAAVCMVVTAFSSDAHSQGIDTSKSRNPDLHLKGDSVLRFAPPEDFVEVYRELVHGSRSEKNSCPVTIQVGGRAAPVAVEVERDPLTCQFIVAYGYFRSTPPASRSKQDTAQSRIPSPSTTSVVARFSIAGIGVIAADTNSLIWEYDGSQVSNWSHTHGTFAVLQATWNNGSHIFLTDSSLVEVFIPT